jgi:glycosyltransferase involved in cell wall biosynthesis
MRIAMVGTRGAPARYGGFETCVEEVGARLSDAGHDVTVYCRGALPDELYATYRGMRLVHLPAMRRRSLETLSHTALSVGHLVVRRPVDVALVFNAANAPFLPLLRARGVPVATHVDGLEWQRSKWGRAGRRYYRLAESLAVRWSDALIADSLGIQDYYRAEFGAATELISYGAPVLQDVGTDLVADLGLSSGGYHLVVARFEPENHVDLVVQGYTASAARRPLVVVGSAPYSDEYTRRVHELADDRVRFLGAVWDQDQLDQLYANACTYWHGHSVGGTNPSLLRALGAGAATNAYDVRFNREVALDTGRYFSTVDDVRSLVEDAEANPASTAERGQAGQLRAKDYDWDDVATSYESLCMRLTHHGRYRPVASRRPSGLRRRGAHAQQAGVAWTAGVATPSIGGGPDEGEAA